MSEPFQIEIFPSSLLLRRCDAAMNMQRFYYLTVHRDLFGGATLVREWGRIGSSGQVRIEPFADEGQAVDALAEIARQKRRRGYTDSREGIQK